MISRKRSSRPSDHEVEALIRSALRERTGACVPSPQVWAEIVMRCADARSGHQAHIETHLAAAWAAVMNWMFPLLEKPTMHCEAQRLERSNAHWTWLTYHHIGVRWAC